MTELYDYREDVFYCSECDCVDGFHADDNSECSCECCCGEETCPYGFTFEECDGRDMAGVEVCEFMCPWNKVR